VSDQRRAVLAVIATVVAFVVLAARSLVRRWRGANEVPTSPVALLAAEEIEPVASMREVAQVQDHVGAPNAIQASSASAVSLMLDEDHGPTRPRLLLGPLIDGQTSLMKEVAEVRDHVEASNATGVSGPSAVSLVLNEDDGSTRPRLLLGPVIDGQTGWSITAPPGGWCPIVRSIRRQLHSKAKVLELPSPGGGKVEASVEMNDGKVVLWASNARTEIQGNYAKVQILATAAWTEGPARWCARVLPLVTLWLLGTEQSGRRHRMASR
jgi:hypothetical protein